MFLVVYLGGPYSNTPGPPPGSSHGRLDAPRILRPQEFPELHQPAFLPAKLAILLRAFLNYAALFWKASCSFGPFDPFFSSLCSFSVGFCSVHFFFFFMFLVSSSRFVWFCSLFRRGCNRHRRFYHTKGCAGVAEHRRKALGAGAASAPGGPVPDLPERPALAAAPGHHPRHLSVLAEHPEGVQPHELALLRGASGMLLCWPCGPPCHPLCVGSHPEVPLGGRLGAGDAGSPGSVAHAH